MDYIGIDLGKTSSQLCIMTDDGELIERRIKTTREQFSTWLGARPSARVLIEATTESEWVARHLESLGHEVVVADPNFAAMYATRSRRVKTDRRDARALFAKPAGSAVIAWHIAPRRRSGRSDNCWRSERRLCELAPSTSR